MLRFTARRLLQLIPVLFGITIAVFILNQIIPGDAVDIMLGPGASESEREQLRAQLGLDQNLVVQYFAYMGSVLRGDFGVSSAFGQPALPFLLNRLGNTAVIAAPAIALAATVGIIAGVFAARRPNSLRDRSITIIVLFFTSMPSFWFGIILILVFGLWLRLLPTSGMTSIIGGGGLVDVLQHAILPVITLAAYSVAIITRMTRSSMVETLSSDYVRTARSRGIPEQQVVRTHALKNAMPPVITVIGLQGGLLLSGAVLTETVFAWPGIGLAVAQAISNRDFAVLQGGILLIAVIFVGINFLVDLLYAYFNPKIKIG